jgi:hypothetical protein
VGLDDCKGALPVRPFPGGRATIRSRIMANVSADTRKVAPKQEMHSQHDSERNFHVRKVEVTSWKIGVCDRGRKRPRSDSAATSVRVWTSVNRRDEPWPVRRGRSDDKTLRRLEIGRGTKKRRDNALIHTPTVLRFLGSSVRRHGRVTPGTESACPRRCSSSGTASSGGWGRRVRSATPLRRPLRQRG